MYYIKNSRYFQKLLHHEFTLHLGLSPQKACTHQQKQSNKNTSHAHQGGRVGEEVRAGWEEGKTMMKGQAFVTSPFWVRCFASLLSRYFPPWKSKKRNSISWLKEPIMVWVCIRRREKGRERGGCENSCCLEPVFFGADFWFPVSLARPKITQE